MKAFKIVSYSIIFLCLSGCQLLIPMLEPVINPPQDVGPSPSNYNAVNLDGDNQPTDALYCKLAAFYAGEANGWYLGRDVLEEYHDTWIGRNVLLGHKWKETRSCVGIITETGVRYDKELKTHYCEMIIKITDEDAIKKVRSGIYRFVSIGMSDVYGLCNIDDKRLYYKTFNFDSTCPECEHNKVTGSIWFPDAIIDRFTGQEVSFVNVPASRWARVLSYSKNPIVLTHVSDTDD